MLARKVTKSDWTVCCVSSAHCCFCILQLWWYSWFHSVLQQLYNNFIQLHLAELNTCKKSNFVNFHRIPLNHQSFTKLPHRFLCWVFYKTWQAFVRENMMNMDFMDDNLFIIPFIVHWHFCVVAITRGLHHENRKFPKYSDAQNICCNHCKNWTMWLYHRVMSPNDADGMANSVDPDQTAPLGAVWSGSALFAQAYLSENLGSLR